MKKILLFICLFSFIYSGLLFDTNLCEPELSENESDNNDKISKFKYYSNEIFWEILFPIIIVFTVVKFLIPYASWGPYEYLNSNITTAQIGIPQGIIFHENFNDFTAFCNLESEIVAMQPIAMNHLPLFNPMDHPVNNLNSVSTFISAKEALGWGWFELSAIKNPYNLPIYLWAPPGIFVNIEDLLIAANNKENTLEYIFGPSLGETGYYILSLSFKDK